MSKNHKLLDRVQNFKGKYIAFFRYIFKLKSKKFKIPNNYKKIFEDRFNSNLNLDKWRYGQPWGIFHSVYLNQYYDTKGSQSFTNHNLLNLNTEYSPKTIIKKNLPKWRQSDRLPDEFTIPNAIGLITSKESFKYGIFKAEIKLPKEKNLWPAFWLCGENSWPPEIDIMEAFTNDKYDDYRGRFFFKKRPNVRIEPNLHYGDVTKGTKQDYGSYRVFVNNATERFVEYVCHWEKDFIKIYFDGVKVFQTTDQKVLKWFNGSKSYQYIVLSNGIRGESFNVNYSNMQVRNISVYQLKPII